MLDRLRAEIDLNLLRYGQHPSATLRQEAACEFWQNDPLSADGLSEQKRNNAAVIPPEFRPRVILRYADTKELLVSGLLDGGSEIAQHPAVIDVPVDRGHIVLFSNNPIWRGETQGSYSLVYNAILNFDSLNAGRKKSE